MTVNALTGEVWDSGRGEFINGKHQTIATIIAEYDDRLRLVYIPRHDRIPGEKFPYKVVKFCDDGSVQDVMSLEEHEVNETVLARLWAGDLSKHNANEYLAKLDAANELIRLREEQVRAEQREEMHDRAKSIFRSPLHTYRLGKGRKVEL